MINKMKKNWKYMVTLLLVVHVTLTQAQDWHLDLNQAQIEA